MRHDSLRLMDSPFAFQRIVDLGTLACVWWRGTIVCKYGQLISSSCAPVGRSYQALAMDLRLSTYKSHLQAAPRTGTAL